MRILFISDFFLPSLGGVERILADLSRELVRNGHRVLVLTQKLDAASPGEERAGGIDVVRFPVDRRNTIAHYGSAAAGSKIEFERALERFRPDRIHSHLTLSSFFLLSAIGRSGIPLIQTFYGPWYAEYVFQSRRLGAWGRMPVWKTALLPVWRPPMAAVMYVMQRKVLRSASRIITLSRFSLSWLGKFGIDPSSPRVQVIPGGVRLEVFSPGEGPEAARDKLGLSSKTRVIFTLRRLVPRMGLEALIRAIPLVRQRHRESVTLLIGGEGPLRASLSGLVRELHLEDSVRLLGRVPEELLADYYRASDLVVLPTLAHENFGLPVVESWACGAPVVAVSQGSLRELLASRMPEYLAQQATPEALSEKIRFALERPDRTGVRERCVRLAREFGWSEIGPRYENLYRQAAPGM
jgi:glycosyltransferase involved in cell wall biosynthesis